MKRYRFPLPLPIVTALFAMAGLLTYASFLISGYDPQHRGGVLHIPMLKAMLDETLYPGDYIVRLKNYPSLLWPVTAALARVTELPSAMFWLCQVQNFLFHFSTALLAYILCGNLYWSTAVSSYFVLLPRAIIGGSIFYDASRLSHGTLSVPFVLLSLSLLLARHRLLAVGCWIIALLLHLPNGVFSLPLLAGVILFPLLNHWQSLTGTAKRLLGVGILAGIATMCSGIVFLVQRDSSSISWELFKNLTGRGIGATGSHIFWSANVEPTSRVVSFAMQQVFIASSLLYSWLNLSRLKPLVFGYVLLHFGLLMGVLAESLQSVSLARLMWIRSADLLCMIGLITAFAISCHPKLLRRRLFAGAVPLLVYSIICMAPEMPSLYCLASIFFLAAAFFKPPVRKQCAHYRILYPAMTVVFAVCVVITLDVPKAHAAQFASSVDTPQYKDFRAAQDWARTTTPKAALFLSPPEMNGWRLFSERSSFLELRDRAAVVLADQTAKEFVRRSRALGLPIGAYTNAPLFVRAYARLTDGQLRTLGKLENISYAVVANDKFTSLPVLYTNSHYKIVPLK